MFSSLTTSFDSWFRKCLACVHLDARKKSAQKVQGFQWEGGRMLFNTTPLSDTAITNMTYCSIIPQESQDVNLIAYPLDNERILSLSR